MLTYFFLQSLLFDLILQRESERENQTKLWFTFELPELEFNWKYFIWEPFDLSSYDLNLCGIHFSFS